jgi:hypothetical protein
LENAWSFRRIEHVSEDFRRYQAQLGINDGFDNKMTKHMKQKDHHRSLALMVGARCNQQINRMIE